MFEVRSLACERGEHRLFSDVSFELAPGDMLNVEGANGSGKTTLLRTLCGFVQPVAGDILWKGKKICDLGEDFSASLVYIGHHNAIKEELNSIENLKLSCRLSGIMVSDDQIVQALRRMGLKGRETFSAKHLSQGQRRRVALAKLLLHRAPLWILDEPLSALDVEAVSLMQSVLGDHLSNDGMVIYTTHQPLEVHGSRLKRLRLT